MNEKIPFEKAGLKIEKDRVLTYSKLSCPYDCSYCFVEDMNFNQHKNVAYLSEEQYELLDRLPEEVTTIMLGCDTEFFQAKEEALNVLEKLASYKKNLSVVSKIPLSEVYIQKLKGVVDKINTQGNVFTFSVSIPCISSSVMWERRVSSPEKRIETLQNLFEAEITTFVALRPLLPTLTAEELEDIVIKTKNYQLGYYSGPLYLKSLDHPLIQGISDLETEKIQPHWMPEGNVFYKVEKEGQMELLKDIIERHGQSLYEGAADAMNHLKKYE